jgi:pyrroloquinoline quinone biosynthesis protein B
MWKRLAILLAACAVSPAFAAGEVFIQVLGIAQDAGLPQANCYRPHCVEAWQDPDKRRLATSIAVIDRDAGSKYLFDATPDMREQLYALHTIAPDDEYELGGVFLTHAHMGHYTGLMHFGREAAGTHGIPVYAMPRMHEFLATNGPWDQLVRLQNIELRRIVDDEPLRLAQNITVTPFLVPHRDEYSETVGFRIDGPNKSAVFIPDIDKWTLWDIDIRDVVRSVDYALLDATFFRDGELGGRDMSKIRHPFVSESMELFDSLDTRERERVIFIHMNHTNPLLQDGSDAQAEVTRRGYRYAHEGMRLDL